MKTSWRSCIFPQLLAFLGVCYSLHTKLSRFPASKYCVSDAYNPITSFQLHNAEIDDSENDPEDPLGQGFENQPEWLQLFPKKRGEAELLREYPDFASLEPNNPLFLDMPWPEKAGPEASAFGKHMQWRRSLSDGERLRWQKWAIYQRLMEKHHFKYTLDDYIVQNMIRDIKIKAMRAKDLGYRMENSMWTATELAFKTQETAEITVLVKALYSAFNRKNYDELRALWLPDDSVEMSFPGYEKARGQNDVQNMYRQIIKDSRPFGAVEATVASVECSGFFAVVQTVEVVVPGTELKFAKKKNAPVVKPKRTAPRRVFATTILRKFNQQWRVVLHHAGRFSSSVYTGDQKDLTMQVQAAATKKQGNINQKSEIESKFSKEINRGGPPMSAAELQSLLKEGSLLSVVNKVNKDGVYEKITSVDNNVVKKEGFGNGYSSSEEEGLISSQQIQASVATNEDISTRLRLGNDGNLYLGDSLVSTTEKERAVIRELEESTMKMNRRGNNGGTEVKSLNPTSGIRISKETAIPAAIDENASVSKQTIQAVRLLFKSGKITRPIKEALILDIIDHVVNHETSLIVVAFELLVVKARDSRQKLRPWSDALGSRSVGLDEFADHISLFSEANKDMEYKYSSNNKRDNDNNRKSARSRKDFNNDSDDSK